MLLFELLNEPGKYERKPDKVSGGHIYELKAQSDGRVIRYEVDPSSSDTGIWELAFGDTSEKGLSRQMGITGKGDELEIMSTAIDIAANFLKENPDAVLYFSAAEPNRIKLYQRIVNRKLPSQFASRINKRGEFYVGKPEQIERIFGKGTT